MCLISLTAFAGETKDTHLQQMLDHYGLSERGKGWDVEPFQDHILLKVFGTDNQLFNEVLMESQSHVDLPYVWGGYSWENGVDCSHFTYKIFKDVGLDYGKYYTTKTMTAVKNNEYLVEVPRSEMRPGDMLVYGYTNIFTKKWSGHVVILIDKDYSSTNGRKGLAVGSHSGVGVQFISYDGFPKYFKYPFYKLRKVLRVKKLYQ